MIDISAIISGNSDAYCDGFKDAVKSMDSDGDGTISNEEIAASSQDVMDEIARVAQSSSEWGIVRELALLKGTYKSLASGLIKGTAPGEGGRFSLMVDSLVDRGYTPQIAQSIAAKIGRAKFAWM